VENFAKTKSVDVRIVPLMCFVGDNNSGKSYLISLIVNDKPGEKQGTVKQIC